MVVDLDKSILEYHFRRIEQNKCFINELEKEIDFHVKKIKEQKEENKNK